MSVYNGERHLEESVASLLTQTHENLEIILVNDGSRDGSRAILQRLQDPRIVVIDRAENIGLTKSLNEGLARARGTYVARLDVGDAALPTRIAAQVRFLEQHPEVGILGTGIAFCAGDRVLQEYAYPGDHETIASLLLRFANPLPHSTLMIRRSVLGILGGYRPMFVRSQDYDLLLRALAHTRFASLTEPLVRWRFEPGSLSYASSGQLTYGIAALVLARYRAAGFREPMDGAAWDALLGRVAAFIGRYRIDVKMGAAKYRILFQHAWVERRWGDACGHAAALLVRSPLFFMHTRTRTSAFIAEHIDELISNDVVCVS